MMPWTELVTNTSVARCSSRVLNRSSFVGMPWCAASRRTAARVVPGGKLPVGSAAAATGGAQRREHPGRGPRPWWRRGRFFAECGTEGADQRGCFEQALAVFGVRVRGCGDPAAAAEPHAVAVELE